VTDEERQELVSNLRNYMPPKRIHPAYGTALHIRAADEIERLVKRNIELETALDKIEDICKHGPDAND
jgi:hypothetical protein